MLLGVTTTGELFDNASEGCTCLHIGGEEFKPRPRPRYPPDPCRFNLNRRMSVGRRNPETQNIVLLQRGGCLHHPALYREVEQDSFSLAAFVVKGHGEPHRNPVISPSISRLFHIAVSPLKSEKPLLAKLATKGVDEKEAQTDLEHALAASPPNKLLLARRATARPHRHPPGQLGQSTRNGINLETNRLRLGQPSGPVKDGIGRPCTITFVRRYPGSYIRTMRGLRAGTLQKWSRPPLRQRFGGGAAGGSARLIQRKTP